MIETIAAVVVGGVALTTYFVSRNKQPNTFTIKSDGVTIDETTSKKPQFTPPRQRQEAPERIPDIKSAVRTSKSIDLRDVTTIYLTGSGDLILEGSKIFINSNTEMVVNNQTLLIKQKPSKKSYITVSQMELYATYNFNPAILHTIGLKGSGDMDIKDLKMNGSLDILLDGSGDIKLSNVTAGSFDLVLRGSGDIELNKKCRATNTTASLNGAGDITINSSNVGTVVKKIKGSGDIHTSSYSSPFTTSRKVEISYGNYTDNLTF